MLALQRNIVVSHHVQRPPDKTEMFLNCGFYFTLKIISQLFELVPELLHQVFKEAFTPECAINNPFSSTIATSTYCTVSNLE